jgi:hypothetical protein
MNAIDGVDPSASAAAQSVQAGQANVAVGSAQRQAQKAGLPPTGLAQAASVNTVNAELVASQWGIDPASVGGVYGGAAESAGIFEAGNLLPLLRSLSPATAERALALIGVQTPTPAATSATAAAYTSGAMPTTTAQAISANGQTSSIRP